MDWMHNPIGDMYGPDFLSFYAVIITAVFFISKGLLYYLDPTRSMNPPQVSQTVEPYEIAYLRGGENEVLRLAMFDLIQRGFLQRTGANQIWQAKDHPDDRYLSPMENGIFSFFTAPYSADYIFKSELPEIIKKYCGEHQKKLEREKLLLDEAGSVILNTVLIIGLILIVGLGGYKLIVALEKGHYNVFFLVIMGVVAIFLHVGIFRPSRISIRGQKYLNRLHLAFERLEKNESKLNFQKTDPSLLLMAGIFGVWSLTGTVYDYYPNIFQKAHNRWYSSGSCGSGCGIASSSCGLGGGGSGGDGGGGGCGGGGCGGCGG